MATQQKMRSQLLDETISTTPYTQRVIGSQNVNINPDWFIYSRITATRTKSKPQTVHLQISITKFGKSQEIFYEFTNLCCKSTGV